MNEVVYDAVAETMEAHAFMEVIPSDSDPADVSIPEPIWAAIDILKPINGRLTLVLPKELVVEITEGMFGFDEEGISMEDVARDTLAELVNIITGRLYSTLIDSNQSLELGLPETGEGLATDDQEVVEVLKIEDWDFLVRIKGGLDF